MLRFWILIFTVPLYNFGDFIEVLYEDEYIIIINKPAGIVCHPAPGHKSGTLVNALAGRWHLSEMGERPEIVHRLDKDTSDFLLPTDNRDLSNLYNKFTYQPNPFVLLYNSEAHTYIFRSLTCN